MKPTTEAVLAKNFLVTKIGTRRMDCVVLRGKFTILTAGLPYASSIAVCR